MKTYIVTTKCEQTDLLHITRVDGEIVEVSKETVFSGPIDVFIGNKKIGNTSEYRLEVPCYKRRVRK